MEILKGKITSMVDDHKPLSKLIIECLDEFYIENILLKYHTIGMSVDWFVRLIRIVYIYIDQTLLARAINSPEDIKDTG